MLTMLKFQYLTFMCDQIELQTELDKHGLAGWRLHTCDPVVTVGPHGSGILQAFVVMDQYPQDDEDEEQVVIEIKDGSEGLAMKG